MRQMFPLTISFSLPKAVYDSFYSLMFLPVLCTGVAFAVALRVPGNYPARQSAALHLDTSLQTFHASTMYVTKWQAQDWAV